MITAIFLILAVIALIALTARLHWRSMEADVRNYQDDSIDPVFLRCGDHYFQRWDASPNFESDAPNFKVFPIFTPEKDEAFRFTSNQQLTQHREELHQYRNCLVEEQEHPASDNRQLGD